MTLYMTFCVYNNDITGHRFTPWLFLLPPGKQSRAFLKEPEIVGALFSMDARGQ